MTNGYGAPNYTQIPNELLDDHMPDMKLAELKVTLAIARKTFGWHKRSDFLSLTQLQELTGLSRPSVVSGIDDGVTRGTIEKRDRPNMPSEYGLVVKNLNHLVKNIDQQVVKNLNTQKKVVKEIKDPVGGNGDRPNLFVVWEKNIGMLTPAVTNELNYWLDLNVPEEWIENAIQIAAIRNKRSMAYVNGILKRYQNEGYDGGVDAQRDRNKKPDFVDPWE